MLSQIYRFSNIGIFDVNGISSSQQMLNDFLHLREINRQNCHFHTFEENEQTTNYFRAFFNFRRPLQLELLECRCKRQVQLYFWCFVPPSSLQATLKNLTHKDREKLQFLIQKVPQSKNVEGNTGFDKTHKSMKFF